MATETQQTTVRVNVETWQRLTSLKQRPGDTIDDVISRLLDERRAAGEDARKAS